MYEQNENPSIGIIICKERDRLDVEYSLKRITSPIGNCNDLMQMPGGTL
ncbi:MAG: DUF1016 domain-containing protein [bacterium]|nr:DUF1016 domain-containing protein [bacterium]